MTPGDAGLLIIRAWIEEGSSELLRAEVRTTTDVSEGIQRSQTLVRAEEVGVAVQEWLADVVGEAGRHVPSEGQGPPGAARTWGATE